MGMRFPELRTKSYFPYLYIPVLGGEITSPYIQKETLLVNPIVNNCTFYKPSVHFMENYQKNNLQNPYWTKVS
jgi:hypothetical protein